MFRKRHLYLLCYSVIPHGLKKSQLYLLLSQKELSSLRNGSQKSAEENVPGVVLNKVTQTITYDGQG